MESDEKHLNLIRTEHIEDLEAQTETNNRIIRMQLKEVQLLRGLIRRCFFKDGSYAGSNREDRELISKIVTELESKNED